MIDFPRDAGRAVVSLSHRGHPLGVARSPVDGLAADPVAWHVHRGLVAILPLVLMASGCGHSLSATQSMHAPAIVRVAHGPVASMVTATGTLHAMTTQSLGFPQGGRITAINVSVGDHVTAGQLLASVDDSRLKVVARNAQDEVTRHQALLDQVTAGNEPGRASAELQLSERLLDATQKAADASYREHTVAIGQLERRLKFDEDDLKRQEKELSVVDQRRRRGSIAEAQRKIIEDQADIVNARAERDSDQAEQQAEIADKRVDLIKAQNKKGLAETDSHYTILARQLELDEAKNNLMLAQQALAATVVKSSFTGTVAQINGSVGKVLTAAYQTALPVPAGDLSWAGGQMPTNSSGPDALIMLDNVDSFQMTVPFAKADVGRMTPNQVVDVSFPAIPGLSRKATVTDTPPRPSPPPLLMIKSISSRWCSPSATPGYRTGWPRRRTSSPAWSPAPWLCPRPPCAVSAKPAPCPWWDPAALNVRYRFRSARSANTTPKYSPGSAKATRW